MLGIIVPTVALPPATLFTSQVTDVSVSIVLLASLTVARKFSCALMATLAVFGATSIETMALWVPLIPPPPPQPAVVMSPARIANHR